MAPARFFGLALLGLGLTSACSVALDFDAVSAQESGNTGFCAKHPAPQAAFCDDFDGKPLGTVWSTLSQMNGTVAVDGKASTSTPSSMLSTISAVPAGGSVRAVSTTSFPLLNSKPLGFRVSFDMQVEQFDKNPSAMITAFAFLYGPLNNYNEIVLNLSSTGTDVKIQVVENAEAGGFDKHGPYPLSAPIGGWINVRLELDIRTPNGTPPAGATNTLRVYLNQAEQEDGPLQVPLNGDVPRMELGIGYEDTSLARDAWSVRYDNFLVETAAL
jgi:hypothetical protein